MILFFIRQMAETHLYLQSTLNFCEHMTKMFKDDPIKISSFINTNPESIKVITQLYSAAMFVCIFIVK